VALPDPFHSLLPTWFDRILADHAGCRRAVSTSEDAQNTHRSLWRTAYKAAKRIVDEAATRGILRKACA
jgi:hypothetical protein